MSNPIASDKVRWDVDNLYRNQDEKCAAALIRIFRFFRSGTEEYAAGSRLENWSARARAASATERTHQNALQRADGRGVMVSPGAGARGARARRWCNACGWWAGP